MLMSMSNRGYLVCSPRPIFLLCWPRSTQLSSLSPLSFTLNQILAVNRKVLAIVALLTSLPLTAGPAHTVDHHKVKKLFYHNQGWYTACAQLDYKTPATGETGYLIYGGVDIVLQKEMKSALP